MGDSPVYQYYNAHGVMRGGQVGMVVARASGMPFEQFLAERIFAPLQMTDTMFLVSDAQLPRVVTNYTASEKGLDAIETAERSKFRDGNRTFDGGGALAGTMEDHLHFAQMLANHG
ncbi:serine hydrolase [Aurantiacibacter flavus]|uniref:Serine hydrolase n=1 Tax=Aurantiacibacter flavus TaxID=3145232 RepID=A0ABV0D113_9SPHN